MRTAPPSAHLTSAGRFSGLWTGDLMRLIDSIGTRGDCDPRRIAGAGFSSGGKQILWLAAMHDRLGRAPAAHGGDRHAGHAWREVESMEFLKEMKT